MCSLTQMQVNYFATILEETLIKLRILVECDHKLQNKKTEHDRTMLERTKYNVEPQAEVDELGDIKPEQLKCDEYKLRKFIDDRKLCDKLLLDTYVELVLKRSYRPLVKYNQGVHDRRDHQLFLADDHARNKILRHDMSKQIRQQRNRIKSSYYESDTVQDKLIVESKDAILKRQTGERYEDAWDKSRLDQNELSMHLKEEAHSEAILLYRRKQDDERRINYNIELFNETNRKEIVERMEAAMLKYEHDIQEIEIKLHRMHSNYDDQVLKRREMEKKVADQGQKMRNWLQFKEEREKIRLYNAKMRQAATIVQAWWRGLLVRLRLGPFKRGFSKKVSKKGNKTKHR